jgi:phosphopantothenoylcysteine decarboxylase/phosphopantothenate--cysteine ligase
MGDALDREAPSADAVIMAAAVADFRPVRISDGKHKKAEGLPEIRLEPTRDLLAGLGAAKPAGQVLVGFAAETDDLVDNARRKLSAKSLDLIVANDVSAPEVGFGHATNAVTILDREGGAEETGLLSKEEIATRVIDRVARLLPAVR